MHTKALIAAVALLAAGSSFAADTLTRAQVQAQTIAARDAGLLDTNEAYQDVAYMAPRAKPEAKPQLAAKPAAPRTVTH